MSEPTIEQMNIAIARFEERKFNGHLIDKFGEGTCNALPEMKYHSSWDWLHPVWEKFRDLSFNKPMHKWGHTTHEELLASILICGTILEFHEALYKAIEWYNRVKEVNNE